MGVIIPAKGVPAGLPLADLLFGLMTAKLTKKIRRRLMGEGLYLPLDSSLIPTVFGSTPTTDPDAYRLSDTTLVDDVLVPVFAQADALIQKVTRVI